MQKRLCSCGCGKDVSRKTEFNHRNLKAPVALLAGNIYSNHITGRAWPAVSKNKRAKDVKTRALTQENRLRALLADLDPPRPDVDHVQDPAYSNSSDPTVAQNLPPVIDDVMMQAQDANPAQRVTIEDVPEDMESDDGEEHLTLEDIEAYVEENPAGDPADNLWDADLFERMEELILGECLAGSLVERDMDYLRVYALRVQAQLTDDAFQMLGPTFPAYEMPSWKAILGRVVFLAGIKPILYHRCPDSCICYVGLYKDDTSCRYCKKPRLDERGRPAAIFAYLPIIPRLKAFLGNTATATQMQYRSRQHEKIVNRSIDDVFDSELYRELCEVEVSVGENKLPYKHFSNSRDVALGFSTDGFSLYRRRRNDSAWPLLMFNYNLPPDVRFHLSNIIALGVIPHKPKDCDSFLWPMVEEMLKLSLGVITYDALTRDTFALRAYLILLFGDMPAMSMLMNMKGHNGTSPCRMCHIKGISIPGSDVHTKYVPLVRVPGNAQANYDPRKLPVRNHEEFIAQAKEVQMAATATAASRLSQAYGIKGLSILSQLSSINFPKSFPHDFMHLIFENLLPNMVQLWTGSFKGLDEGKEEYQIDLAVWKAIGKACAQAGGTIPASYGPKPEDISDPAVRMTADAWSFWALYLGPILLERRFKKAKYYKHFTELVRLLNLCLQFSCSSGDVRAIKEGFATWVEKYEKYYYQYDLERLPTCVLTIHALLHIGDSITQSGPVWASWAFPMERYCGLLQRTLRSRRFPYASLDRYVYQSALLTHIKAKHNIHQELSLKIERQSVGATVPGYNHCKFLEPFRKEFTPSPALWAKINRAVRAEFRLPGNLRHRVQAVLPAVVEEWGKLVILPAGDLIRSSLLGEVNAAQDNRSAAFVRYELLDDVNYRSRNAEVALHKRSFYGQLRRILTFTFPAIPELGVLIPKRLVLAVLAPCNIIRHHETLDIHYYRRLLGEEVYDIETVQCVVAQITRRPDHPGESAVFDRSGSLSRAVWNPGE